MLLLQRAAPLVLITLSACAPAPAPVRLLVSAIEMPDPSGDGVIGLDLDGVDSAGGGATCTERHPDWSSIDGSEAGVDNVLAELMPTLRMLGGDLDAALDAQIAEGRLLLAIDVTALDSVADDEDVAVELFRARADRAPFREGAIDPEARIELVSLARARGRVRAGVLDVELDVPFTLPLIERADDWLAFPMRRARIEIPLEAGAARGVLAGAVDLRELGRSVDCSAAYCRPDAGIDGDLDPAPEDPTRCEAMSLGLGIEAVVVPLGP